MNSKNLLQEHFQKQQQQLPVYQQQQIVTNSNQILWQSTVFLTDEREFSGLPCSKKSSADISAAEQALSALGLRESANGSTNETMKKTRYECKSLADIIPDYNGGKVVVLYDLENIPNPPTNFEPESNVVKKIGFKSRFSTVSSPEGTETISINSAVSDAADHAMTYYAGRIAHCIQPIPLESKDKQLNFLLYSRDKFVSILGTLLQSDGYKVTVITSV